MDTATNFTLCHSLFIVIVAFVALFVTGMIVTQERPRG